MDLSPVRNPLATGESIGSAFSELVFCEGNNDKEFIDAKFNFEQPFSNKVKEISNGGNKTCFIVSDDKLEFLPLHKRNIK